MSDLAWVRGVVWSVRNCVFSTTLSRIKLTVDEDTACTVAHDSVWRWCEAIVVVDKRFGASGVASYIAYESESGWRFWRLICLEYIVNYWSFALLQVSKQCIETTRFSFLSLSLAYWNVFTRAARSLRRLYPEIRKKVCTPATRKLNDEPERIERTTHNHASRTAQIAGSEMNRQDKPPFTLTANHHDRFYLNNLVQMDFPPLLLATHLEMPLMYSGVNQAMLLFYLIFRLRRTRTKT